MGSPSTKHILIIEDSVDLQALLSRLLAKQGYIVSKAYNGQEALDVLSAMKTLPDLILLDIMMPVMDGFVFRQEMQKDLRLNSIPVVVMSADSHPRSKDETLKAAAFMRKPVDIDDLLKIAEKLSA